MSRSSLASNSQTPWDKLAELYIEIEVGGHEFPVPARYLPPDGSKVLDLGCGVGTHMRLFQESAGSVVGVDISSAMVTQALRVAPVARADSRKLPFADASFDYLWSRVVISCVPDWSQAFEDALRVVQPGGRLVLLVANKWSAVTPFRALLSSLGRYSEGYITHLSRRNFAVHSGRYPFRILETFAVQKEARSANPLFLAGAAVMYGFDRLISRIFPAWGGDLCLVIERL